MPAGMQVSEITERDQTTVAAPVVSTADAFLDFLERDIADKKTPRVLPADFFAEGRALVDGIEIDLDAPLE